MHGFQIVTRAHISFVLVLMYQVVSDFRKDSKVVRIEFRNAILKTNKRVSSVVLKIVHVLHSIPSFTVNLWTIVIVHVVIFVFVRLYPGLASFCPEPVKSTTTARGDYLVWYWSTPAVQTLLRAFLLRSLTRLRSGKEQTGAIASSSNCPFAHPFRDRKWCDWV